LNPVHDQVELRNQVCNLRVDSAFLVFLLLLFGQSITDNLCSIGNFISLSPFV